VAELRARGPEGLEQALLKYDKLQAELAKLRQQEPEFFSASPFDEPGKEDREATTARYMAFQKQVVDLERRIESTGAAIDEIGGQRSCTVSRLYWYTDL
jgi:hypothetical protein